MFIDYFITFLNYLFISFSISIIVVFLCVYSMYIYLYIYLTARLFSGSDCTILRSHQQCVKVPVFSYPCQHLLLSVSFIHPSGCEVVLIVVLVCISLMTNYVEHLFLCLMTICIFSLESSLFRSFVHF